MQDYRTPGMNIAETDSRRRSIEGISSDVTTFTGPNLRDPARRRHYLDYLEKSIGCGTQWVAFEPNAAPLWTDLRSVIEDFLYREWQAGRLHGSAAREAYFVRCDRSTMSQNDIDNSRLICEIGIALLKPAEFVIFRIACKTAG